MDRDTFFTAAKAKTTDIPLEDGRIITARKLTQAEVEVLKKRYASEDKALEGLRYVVSRTVVNADGERVFKDEDMSRLAEVDFDVIEAIAGGVAEFSGLGRNAKKP